MAPPVKKTTLRDEILSKVDFYQFYAEYIRNLDDSKSQNDNLICPLHDDSVGSLSVDLKRGVWYCHGSCGQGGSVFDFIMKKKACDFRTAISSVAKKVGIDELDSLQQKPFDSLDHAIKDVNINHELLLNNPEKLKYLKEKRGITEQTIKQLKIGFDEKEERTWFPIFSRQDDKGNERLLNIRKHREGDNEFKVIGVKGFNSRLLWPIHLITSSGPIYLFAGEMDCCHAISLGFENCITNTGGETNWHPIFNIAFQKRDVIIVYDNDKSGKTGAQKICRSILPKAKSVKIVELPVPRLHEDFTDYIIKYGNTVDDFIKLCANTGKQEKEKKQENKIQQDIDLRKDSKHDYSTEIIETTLEDASNKDFNFKMIKTSAHVIGKDFTPFIVPRTINVTCGMNMGEKCLTCPMLAKVQQDKGANIKFDDYSMLKFVDVSDKGKNNIIKSFINAKCSTWRVVVEENENFEELIMVPKITYRKEKHEDTIRTVYYMGQGLPTNSSYEIIARTVPHPKTQHATQIIYNAKSSATDIDSFSLSGGQAVLLDAFRPVEDSVEAIDMKLKDIYEDLSHSVLKVYNRFEIFLTMNLVWFGVLNFKFKNDELKKSHVEALVIGDTRTGKSKMAERLMEHYEAGELINCEKATIPGLIGGMVSANNSQILQWGAIPLNHRRLCILDESDGLDQEIIANMSGIRSSCIAERTVAGGTRKTMAKTRLLWISNPRGFLNVRDANSGVEIIKRLIGKPEDIARFDLISIISEDDVSLEIISEHEDIISKNLYTSEMCHALIMWAWSRKSEQIHFTNSAIKQVDISAKKLAEKYTPEIALVHPAEQRIKIARLSAALAAMLFSTNTESRGGDDNINNYSELIIRKTHVLYIEKFLQEIYDSTNFGYDMYSELHVHNLKFSESLKTEIRNKIGVFGKTMVINLLDRNTISRSDIQIMADCTPTDANSILSYLQKVNAIRQYGKRWIKTDPFRQLLKEIRSSWGDTENATGSTAEKESKNMVDFLVPESSDYEFE